MLRVIMLVAVLFGMTSTAYAATPSLFGDLFGKSSFGKSSSMTPVRASSVAGPVSITVDITTQEMIVASEGRTIYTFDVSTGRKGYTTPTGNYKPIRMHEMWYSSKYENAPMPHAIFFYGGYAIHGTEDIGHLGTIASHGCVRLDPANATLLYDLVKQVGMKNTKISLIRS